jgi:hypothetical protein
VAAWSDWLPHLVDAVIALSLAEAAWLAWLHRRHGRGVAPGDYALNLASGLCLMLALRLSLAGSGPAPVMLCLLAAGLLHAGDLWRRWR